MAFVVCLMGVVNIVSAWVGIERARLVLLRQVLPLEIDRGSRTLTVLAGLLLIWLSWSLFRRKRNGWIAATLVLAVSVVLHLLKGLDYEEASGALVLLGGLWLTRREFVVRSDRRSVGDAVRATLMVLGAGMLYGVAGFALLHHHFTPGYSITAAARSTFFLLAQTGVTNLHPLAGHRDAFWFLDSLTAIGLISALAIAGILLRPVAAVMHLLDHERAEVNRLLAETGGPPLAYWTLLPGMHYFFHAQRRAVIAYRVVQGVAIVLGDPLGHAEAIPETIRQFAEHCRVSDWLPAWYQVTERWLPAFHARGWSGMKVGEDACVPLADLAFTGKAWQDIRTALNRLPREGYSAVWYDLTMDVRGWIPALTTVSRDWQRRQHGAEKSFSLGTWETAQRFAGEQRLLVLLNAQEQPAAFLVFAPVFGADNDTCDGATTPGGTGGWALDLMRREAELPSGAMEYLLATALQTFRQEGAACVSLGLAPLAAITPENTAGTPELLARIRSLIYTHFSSLYNFQGLQRFKEKFKPRWEGRYLVYPSLVSLPLVLLALIQVHQPRKTAPLPRILGRIEPQQVTGGNKS